MVTEGTTVKLNCRARGYPPPKIEWRREDGQKIVLRDESQNKKEGKRQFLCYIIIQYVAKK